MASEKITNILEEIKSLTILELSDLVKAVEEEFGVSAAAPVGVVAAAGDDVNFAVPVPALKQAQSGTVHQGLAVCAAGDLCGIAGTHDGNGNEFFHENSSDLKKGNAIPKNGIALFFAFISLTASQPVW